jgi:heme-degrading monooxygenase HmoA
MTNLAGFAGRNGPADDFDACLSHLRAGQATGIIARIWRARSTAVGFPLYLEHFRLQVVPALRAIAGYRGYCVLLGLTPAPSAEGVPAPAQIEVITYWESMEAIISFAGADCSRAVVQPQARDVLVDFDETVRHYDLRAVEFPHNSRAAEARSIGS